MKLLLDHLAEAFKKFGDKTAFVDHNGKRWITYRELNALSGAVAARIIEKGCKKGDAVTILMPRGYEYIAAEIGALKAGCAFAPIASDYPAERVEHIIKDSGSKLLIDLDFVHESEGRAPAVSVPVSENDSAYMIYTSGSTGKPKGILHSHKSLVKYVLRFVKAEGAREADVFLSLASMSFIASIFENIVPLTVGGTVHIMGDEGRRDVHAVENYIAEHGVTVCNISPAMLKLFKNKSEALRLVTTGSERVTNQAPDGYRLMNMYGSSEIGVMMFFNVDKKYANTPLGKPAEDMRAYILDECLNPVPDGEAGELCVAGPISDGYINNPEKNASAFVKNPFSDDADYGRMFRTGDIAKLLPDGNILYLNRKDWMVKINGQRVETGETEVTMQSLSGVSSAAVKAFENESGQNFLCAYYTGSAAAEDIRASLEKTLPAYMIPLFFVKLDKMPLNANGKIDRFQLSRPDASLFKSEYAAPRTETEKAICSAFENILACGRVGIHDDFFALGGDSIKAMTLQNRCAAAGLTIEMIYEGKTPEKISAICENKGEDLFAACEAPSGDVFPLTPSQLGVYFECVKNPSGTMYNIPFYYEFDKHVDISRLTAAVKTAVSAHESFCFAVEEIGGEPLMHRRRFNVEIPVIKTAENELQQALMDFVKPFDITKGPLFRFAVFECGECVRLAVDLHHLAFDGTSVGVLAREISAIYDGKDIPPEKIGQFGMSVYEQRLPETEAYARAEEYAREKFAGREIKTMLPADFKENEAVADKPCGKITRMLSDELSAESVKGFISALGVTENTLFLGAFIYAAAKFSAQSETVVCAASHGRHSALLENATGMLVRTLPLYTNIGDFNSVKEYLTAVENDLRAAAKYDCVPFSRLAAEFGLEASMMFAYQSDAFNSIKLDGVTYEMRALPAKSALAPISAMIFKSGGGFEINIDYRADLYAPETVNSFIDMYVTVLGGMTRKKLLRDLPLVNSENINRIFEINRKTDTVSDLDRGFVTLFRAQARKTPDKTAVVYGDRRITYRELDELTDRLACYLRKKGANTESVVPVLVNRNEFMTVCAIGVLKSGAGYQPLDPSYPTERLNFMIKDAGGRILIAEEELMGRITDFDGETLKTSEIARLPGCDITLPEPKRGDMFVILYTSGSTGTPKGCMLTHGNITNFIHWAQKTLEVTENSASGAYASFGFDAHMIDIYPFLSCGAAEYIIPEDKRLDMTWINEYCRANGITNLFMTTQVGRAFVTSVEDIAPKVIMTGGEKLTPLDPPKGVKFINAYGPTECSIITSCFCMDRYYDPIPIGTGVDNAHIYIVDKDMRMLPVGAAGELCVAGPLVSRGYLNRPEKTAEVYVSNPFENNDRFSTVYRTGDICRFTGSGLVEYVGRQDGLVKIRGYRIELTEIDAVIREYESVRDVAVVAKDKAGGGKYVAAYVVSDEQVDFDKLAEFIAERKPPYLVPEAFMQIDSVPLNINGKIDRKKLPEISAPRAETPSSPHILTELEKKLITIVSEIIGTDDINVDTELTRCGMTSLSVIKLAARLNKLFGFGADIKTLMKGCSVLSIENMLTEFAFGKKSALTSETAQNKVEYAPLSYTQYGVYSECMKQPDSSFYNIPLLYAFPADFSARRLADAVESVLRSQPYVFAQITVKDDDIVQTRKSPEDFSVSVKEIPEEHIREYLSAFDVPFRLMDSRLFKTEVIKSEKAVYLFAVFHHIIFDGTSADLFIHAVKEAYEGNVPETAVSDYFDYTVGERNARGGDRYNSAEKYFAEMLEGCESASEITPDLNGTAESGGTAMVSVRLDMDKIGKFCNENGFTPAHLTLAAALYVTMRFTDGTGAYINTISSGRGDARFSNDFGMFVKTLPIGTEIGGISALDFVKKAKELLTGAVDNELYPYSEVCRKFGYAPKIMFAYQVGVTEELTVDGAMVKTEFAAERRLKFQTGIYVEENNGFPCVDVLYDSALYSEGYMRTFAESIVRAAERIIEDPRQSIRTLSLLPENVSRDKPEKFDIEIKLLHKLFEKQAALTPEKTALIACDGKFTYECLNLRANAVANSLISRGIGRGSRVVILLPRTSEFFAAMFGILKAGAAFIPTCPDYPRERIYGIIDDSGADAVITRAHMTNMYPKTLEIEALEKGSTEAPDADVSPEDLAYLIYTSGSTGKPKGVMLRHIGIANYLTDHERNIQVRSLVESGCKCFGSVTTVSFDMSLKETANSLCNGITLAFADDKMTLDAVKLTEFLRENNVDAFNATPSRLLVYMELEEFAEVMKGCKVIMSGGEKYPENLLKILRENTDARILNTYGPTEITVSSNAKELTHADRITVGKPLLNYVEYIADRDGNELPRGAAGELIIGGAGVAAGYNGLPEQTEKAFFERASERYYRSGDSAKMTEDGEVIILGRKDDQIKLRGLRIELGEIEKTLSEIDGIRSAAVAVRKIGNEEGLCAYYAADSELDPDMLKREAGRKLTDYMIPSAFVFLKEMPLTPNGKTDRKALARIELKAAPQTAASEPETETEKAFCEIFQNVLNLSSVSADGSFFELGGTSLTVTRVVIAAGKRGYNIAYGDVFSNPTPKALAKFLGDSSGEEANELENYDYTAINELLKNNTEEKLHGEKQPLGNVILTGATGFLGIHILRELLDNYGGRVFCLLRNKGGKTAASRMRTMYYYYFERDLTEYGKRVTVIDGDITDKASFERLKDTGADTVINCAANVKHFSKGNDIEEVNYNGVKNIIGFCKDTGARLIQVSTMSVGGVWIGKRGAVEKLKETQLFFGQRLTSKYTAAKFMAEREVLENAAAGKLNAKIMRVGTIAPRNTDGEYQINFTTNTFMGRLKATYLIGCYPFSAMSTPFEMSPVDQCARAVLLLSQTPKECVVFHPYNNHMLLMSDMYAEMNRAGLSIRAAEEEEFRKASEKAKDDPEKASVLSSFIAYENAAHGQTTFPVGKSNDFTMQALYRAGFIWSPTTLEYMRKFLVQLKGLGFFDEL